MDPRVQSIEKKTVKLLKEELKFNPSSVNMKNKEELVKLMLTEQNILSCKKYKYFFIGLPKNIFKMNCSFLDSQVLP
jgi:hypothetical protein